MQKIVKGINDLATTHPAIAQEWHTAKNAPLTAGDVSYGSNRKVFWHCPKGHEYQEYVYKHVQGKSCPYCSNKKVLVGYNDLKTLYPQIAAEWDYKENKGIDINHIIPGSTKAVHWRCSACGYKWIAKVCQRTTQGTGCPLCSIKKRAIKRHLTALEENGAISNPVLLAEWDHKKNKGRKPEEFSAGSNQYAYWKCSVCGYGWRAKISNRALLGRGCPCCANKVVVPGKNDLATTHPVLAAEWQLTLNGSLTPKQVTVGSGKKAWWLCPRGHSYRASIMHRGHGTKCPICNSGRQTSFAEQAVFYYIKQLYPDAVSRYKADFLGRMELDIFIPSIRYAIEYDGVAWHGKDKLVREQKKYRLCRENNIKLIRLREKFPELGSDIADKQFGGEDLYEHRNLESVIHQLLSFLYFKGFGHPNDVSIERDQYKILKFSQELDGPSFLSEYPELTEEWDYAKNGSLTPSMFKPHSDQIVWWKCKKCGYGYQASMGHRSYGTGCPKCGAIKSAAAKAKRVNMIDPMLGVTVRQFDSISEAAREMHVNSSNISMACKGTRTKAGGYKWRYGD